MKTSVKKAFLKGVPFLAECGGFMYLLEEIQSKEGREFPMVGAINGSATYKDKLVRFGYVTIDADDIKIKGHEFHYYDTDNNGTSCVARKACL